MVEDGAARLGVEAGGAMTEVSRDTLAEEISSRRKYRSPARTEQRDRTRAKLIQIVLDFIAAGTFRPGLAAVAERAEVHLSLVHRGFGSINGLYAVVAASHAHSVCSCAVTGLALRLSDEDARVLAHVIMTGQHPETP